MKYPATSHATYYDYWLARCALLPCMSFGRHPEHRVRQLAAHVIGYGCP